jgi:hypothetical protein
MLIIISSAIVILKSTKVKVVGLSKEEYEAAKQFSILKNHQVEDAIESILKELDSKKPNMVKVDTLVKKHLTN